ncbi:hypothetical protein DYQ86_14115 [Acidobacteria bacterium AB60]|nr:hypothetical protein DYQ86_14115 [Acidobacteria bacterium AB60]
MKKTMFGMVATIAMALAGSQPSLQAQENHSIEGTWDVSVTVVDCQSGALIRKVRSLQMYSHDGSFTETANTFLRGSSLGSWTRVEADLYTPTYWFFRYNPDGTFKSLAEGSNKVELSSDGTGFSATGTITDFDASGKQISVGCVTQTAERRTSLKDE